MSGQAPAVAPSRFLWALSVTSADTPVVQHDVIVVKLSKQKESHNVTLPSVSTYIAASAARTTCTLLVAVEAGRSNKMIEAAQDQGVAPVTPSALPWRGRRWFWGFWLSDASSSGRGMLYYFPWMCPHLIYTALCTTCGMWNRKTVKGCICKFSLYLVRHFLTT